MIQIRSDPGINSSELVIPVLRYQSLQIPGSPSENQLYEIPAFVGMTENLLKKLS